MTLTVAVAVAVAVVMPQEISVIKPEQYPARWIAEDDELAPTPSVTAMFVELEEHPWSGETHRPRRRSGEVDDGSPTYVICLPR